MCTTSRRGRSKAEETLLDVLPVKPPVTPGHALQEYLSKAYGDALTAHELGLQPADDSTAKLHVPISIFLHVNGNGPPHYAGIHHDEVHFSASLLKAAAMFAAFSLFIEANALAAQQSFVSLDDFISALGLKFNSNDAVPAIINAGVGLKPQYKKILFVTGFGAGRNPDVKFQPDFLSPLPEDELRFKHYLDVQKQELDLGNIRIVRGEIEENAKTLAALAQVSDLFLMIVKSDNSRTSKCINNLGFAYINVTLMNGGFYDRASVAGIWLAANFVGGTRVGIDSVNDLNAAQVTTTRKMSELFSLIQRGKLVHDESSPAQKELSRLANIDMKTLLRAANDFEPTWLGRGSVRLFTVEAVKIGVANLKPNTNPMGPDVYSEANIARWNDAAKLVNPAFGLDLNGVIVRCWQNLRDGTNVRLDGIAGIVERTVSGFLDQTPV